MDKRTIAKIEHEAARIARGVLVQGGSYADMQGAVRHYLIEHWNLDTTEWVWALKTPWQGKHKNVLTAWDWDDVAVTVELKSAVDRLGELPT